MEILDSGVRRQFESGAVRDSADGRGRCDLLPLDIVGGLIRFSITETMDPDVIEDKAYAIEKILDNINDLIRNGNSSKLIYESICIFIKISQFKSVYDAIMEVSKHYEDGARKYAERNWEKGISCHCYIDSGVRHLLKWLDGWDDEPHDRAFIWNMLGLLWTVKHKPECNDLPYAKEADAAEERGIK